MNEVLITVMNVAVVLCAGVAVFAFRQAQKAAKEMRQIAMKISAHIDRLNETERETND